MALSFPSNPSVGQTFTSGTKTWSWSGEQWVAKNVSVVTPGGGGTVTGGQNSGTGIGTFGGVSGTNLLFKSVATTGTNITVSEASNTLTISAPNAVVNSQNVAGSTGEGSVVPSVTKNGSNLQFKKIKAGSGVTVTDGTSDIIISSSGGGGSGTVTNVTGTSPISVANGTTTPAISLGIVPSNLGGAGTVNGILKANGSGTVSAAVAGTDYLTSANFTGTNQSLTTSGYQRLPGGLIIQWINGNQTNGVFSLNFPISFPNAFLGAVVTEGNADGWFVGNPLFITIYGESGSTLSLFQGRMMRILNGGGFNNNNIVSNFNAIAIGY